MADAFLLAVIALLVFLVSFTFANVGLGGGGLYVPILLLLYVPTWPAAAQANAEDIVVPISLALATATAISSTLTHRRKGYVDLRLGRSLMSGALVGAILGSAFTIDVLTASGFEVFFAALLFTLACALLYDWSRGRQVEEDDDGKLTPRRISVSSVLTAASGFVSGSAGVGGGVFNVPILTYGLGRRTRTAIGTSSLLIIPTAIFGVFLYVLREGLPVEFLVIPIMFPLALVGAYMGSRWGLEALRAKSIALLFIGVVFLADALVVLEIVGLL